MAEVNITIPEVQNEFQQIMEHIRNGNNFLLSGGAGSGKTYTLVNVIREVIEENPTSKIACMTYTNAAVKEIEERVNHDNLSVTTIHDFLWDNIKHFQKELKSCLISLINDGEENRISSDFDTPIAENFFDEFEKGVQYKEFVRLREAIVSHDEVLILANKVFQEYPKINSILKDKFNFIFIDEYQDTNKGVVEIFLEHFNQSDKKCVVGFFGDAMQSIYDNTIGDLDEYKGDEDNQVTEIFKEQNRRNPQSVINLANRLRTDGLTQQPSEDVNAPNMNPDGTVKRGRISFIYSSVINVPRIKEFLGWDFNDTKETKQLNLTHNLIASQAGIRNLMDIYNSDRIIKYKDSVRRHIRDEGIDEDFSHLTFNEVIRSVGKQPTRPMQRFIDDNPELYADALAQKWELFSNMYVDKDQLLDSKKQHEDDETNKGSKRDALIRHLFKIQNNIHLYVNRRYNEFLRATDFKFRFTSIESKRVLKQSIEELLDVGDKTIEEIISDANEKGICIIDDKLEQFIAEKQYLFNRVKNVKFKEFQNLYDYLEGFTPFSTQHKTKGTEFNNVLVILDNGGWRNYNFENLFIENGSESVLKRTQKLFYVCCTRAKESLAVYFENPNPHIIQRAQEWFGEDNIIDLDTL